MPLLPKNLPSIARDLFVAGGFLCFASCGQPDPADQSNPESISPEPAGGTEVLPQSGQITTSAQSPSAPQGFLQPDGSRYIPLDPEQQKRLQEAVLLQEAQAQAAGLGSGKVTVNRAWNYTGWTVLEIRPDSNIEARFVAIDVTVEGHTRKFDSDDIEIVDPSTGASYGSDPHSVFLTPEGKVANETDQIPIAPQPTRMLLIYAYPKATNKLNLSYWHQTLLNKPVEVEPDGWALPFPKRESGQTN